MSPSVAALLSVVALALVSLVGIATLWLGRARFERVVFLLVAFAVGAMLGGALLHLIPEAYEALGDGPRVGLLVLAGVLGFFVLEKFLHWHHAHGVPGADDPGHAHAHGHGHSHDHSHDHGADPFAWMLIAGNVSHKLVDGAIVTASYLVSIPTGLVTTAAVLLHEIPQAMGHFGVLVYAGMPPRRALGYNLASGLAGLVGAGAVLALGPRVDGLADTLLPITAGAFLYIAGSDLIPELNRRHSQSAAKSAGQLAMMLLGIAVMAVALTWH